MKPKTIFKTIAVIYTIIGLFIATIGGLTRDTIDRVGAQEIWDNVIRIEKAFRSASNYLYICYSGVRANKKQVENWVLVPLEIWKKGDKYPYYKIKPTDSFLQDCTKLPNHLSNAKPLEIKLINSEEFNKYFNILNRDFDFNRGIEKVVYTEDKNYIKFGYVRTNLPNSEEIMFQISTPVIEISGEKKWIAFLPIALIVDVLIWPERMSKFLNSSHMHQ